MIQKWIALLILWIGLVNGASAHATVVPSAPEAAVAEFYRWYLQASGESRDPLTQDRKTMSKYVTAACLREAMRERNSPNGPDHDYFTRTQDWPEDWKTTMAFSGSHVRSNKATTTIALGVAGSTTRNWLDISMTRDNKGWKISRVRAHPGARP